MVHTRSSVVVLLVFFACFSSQAQEICHDPKIPDLVKSGTPAWAPGGSFLNSLASSDIVMVGEIHFHTALAPRLELIRQFKKRHPGNSCVAFELPVRDHGPEVTMANFKHAIRRMKEKENGRTNPEDVETMEWMQSLLDYYNPMIEEAVQLGMKAKSVDHRENFDRDISIDERNAVMANNLSDLMSKKECGKILMFVGKAHFSTLNEASTTISELTTQRGHQVVSVNLQMTKENLPQLVRSWSICPSFPVISDYAVLENRFLMGNPLLFPFLKAVHTEWKSFDYTLLAP